MPFKATIGLTCISVLNHTNSCVCYGIKYSAYMVERSYLTREGEEKEE